MSISVLVAAAAIAMVAAGVALAHVERTTFWPDPKPDKSVKPAAGGEVPEYRPLASALKRKARGDTRVVCQDDSLELAKDSIGKARKGFKLRPSEDKRRVSRKQGRKLRKLNKRFLKKCKYDSIQDAVNDSGNNDRVVIMPGTYTEPDSLAKPENDPACEDLLEDSDHNTGAVSYRYQAACPNDQNLIAVMGRTAEDVATPTITPRTDRHGIPSPGECIRCNLQIEGSGARPHDVVVDAGNGPVAEGPEAGEGKDVGIRVERADGFYLRNVTLKHAEEHGVYPVEVDGYAIDRVRMLYNHDYGHLAFTSDHGLLKDCAATGSGDAGVYPGASAQTGEQTVERKRRYNHLILRCDLYHNTLGHSGSMGDGIRIRKSDVYDNAVGLSVDSISAGGHPGYPQDSLLVEKSRIYSNNFNPYVPGSDVVPTVSTAAVGTGAWVAGGNGNIYRKNRIYDNWRRGIMLFQVPDSIACPAPPDAANETCSAALFNEQSNSHRNRFVKNTMGIAPGGKQRPNGLDFWWGEQEGDEANCWIGNRGVDGTKGSVTGDPDPLPSDCATSLGTGEGPGPAAKFDELITCNVDPDACSWLKTPPRPPRP